MGVGGSFNSGNGSNSLYNEGLFSSKKGYIKWGVRPQINGGVNIGPNLDIEYFPGTTPAQKADVYLSFTGTELANVSKACEAFANCTAPLVTTGDVCRNIDGTIPDPCTYGAIIGTPTTNDPDGDGINNICDLDDDGDGVPDTSDTCEGFDDAIDNDLDGIPDLEVLQMLLLVINM